MLGREEGSGVKGSVGRYWRDHKVSMEVVMAINGGGAYVKFFISSVGGGGKKRLLCMPGATDVVVWR